MPGARKTSMERMITTASTIRTSRELRVLICFDECFDERELARDGPRVGRALVLLLILEPLNILPRSQQSGIVRVLLLEHYNIRPSHTSTGDARLPFCHHLARILRPLWTTVARALLARPYHSTG